MPNWIEGTLKVRGTPEKIIAFLENGLMLYKRNAGIDEYEPQPLESWASIIKDDYFYAFTTTTEKKIHVNDTRRAFVTNVDVEIDLIESAEKVKTVCLDIQQAWAFTDNGKLTRWEQLSEKYSVDFRLYGIERGMRFVEEVIICNGKTTLHNTTKYEDWDWDCPFPYMGG